MIDTQAGNPQLERGRRRKGLAVLTTISWRSPPARTPQRVGQLTERTVAAATEVTAIAALQLRPPVNLTTTVERAQEHLLAITDSMKFLQHGLFLGFQAEREHPEDDVFGAMTHPSVNETQWVRSGAGRPESGQESKESSSLPAEPWRCLLKRRCRCACFSAETSERQAALWRAPDVEARFTLEGDAPVRDARARARDALREGRRLC